MFHSFTKIFSILILMMGMLNAASAPANGATLVGVQVTPDNTYVLLDENEQYTATAVYDDGTTVDVTSDAAWLTSDSDIAFISDEGLVTGLNRGTVTIAATYMETTSATNLDVLKDDPMAPHSQGKPPAHSNGKPPATNPANTPEHSNGKPPTVSLTIDGSDVVAVGDTAQLIAILELGDGTIYTVNSKVDWISDSETVAEVNATTGVVTGVEPGGVTITATAKVNSGIVAAHSMTVTGVALESIQIELGYNPDTPDPIETLEVPITEEVYITAWGIYSDGSREYINTDTFWWSSDQQVASIFSPDSSNVYGRDLGTATVTAYYQGKQDSIVVTVVNNGPALTAITLKTDDGTDVTSGAIDAIPAGFKTWVTAYGTYDDGTTGVNINRYVSYSSSDKSVAYVIDEIDSNIRGRSEGSAIITAEWQGVSASVTAPVIGLTSIVIKTGEGASTPPPGTVIDINNPLTLATGRANKVYVEAYGIYTDDIERYINTLVFWRSADQDIASMSLLQRDSWVTGENAGTTVISAKLVGVEGNATVIVTDAP